MLKITKTRILFFASTVLFALFTYMASRDGIVLFGDMNIPLIMRSPLLDEFFVWHTNNFGQRSSFPTSPYHLVWKILSQFLSFPYMSHLYAHGQFFLLGLSVITLVTAINKKFKLLDSTIVAIAATTSPLIVSLGFIGGDQLYSYATVFFAIAYICWQESLDKMRFKHFVILFCILLFGNSYLQTMVFFYVFLTLYLVTVKPKELFENKWKVVTMGGLFFLFNMYWLMGPAYQRFAGQSLNTMINYDPAMHGMGTVNSIAMYQKTFVVFTFWNNFPMLKDIYGARYYVLIVQMALFVLVVLGNFVYRPESGAQKRNLIFFLGVIIFCSIFTWGTRGKWTVVFQFFWDYVPAFNTYRSIYKFLTPIYFSLLILLVLFLRKMDNKRWVKLLILLGIAPTLACFTREFASTRFASSPVPSYYDDYAKATKNTDAGYTKILPDKSWMTVFTWMKNNYDAANILAFYNRNFILYNHADKSFDRFSPLTNDALNDLLVKCESSLRKTLDTEKILGILSIRDIVFQQDVLYRKSGKTSEDYCPERLREIPYLQPPQFFGKLERYENKSPLVLPLFFIPTDITLRDDVPTNFLEWISVSTRSVHSAAVYVKQNAPLKADQFALSPNQTTVEFTKLNPTKYRATFKNAKTPFAFVFNQSFDPNWQVLAKISSSKKFAPIPDENHVQINSFANGWLVDPAAVCTANRDCRANEDGNYSIEAIVHFRPQTAFMMGVAISVITILGSLILALRTKKPRAGL